MSGNGTSWIGSAVVVAVVPAILGLLFNSAKARARCENDRKWVEYGRPLKGFSVGVLLLALVFFVGSFFVDKTDRWVVWSMAIFVGSIGLVLSLEFFFVRVSFTDDGMTCYSPWRRTRRIRWDEVDSVKFSHVNQWWILRTESKGKVRLDMFLSGLAEFRRVLDEQKKVDCLRGKHAGWCDTEGILNGGQQRDYCED